MTSFDPSSTLELQLREMNQALLISSVHQHELTEQAQNAERAARDSEERFRTLFNSMDEGFCVIELMFDRNGSATDYRFLEVNPAFEQQCGLHDVIGKRMREVTPNHDAFWFEIFGKVAVTGRSVRVTREAKALGRWFDLNAFRIGGSENRRVAVIFSDVSGRMRMETELHDSEVRYRRLFESATYGILILDAQTNRITDANPYLRELSGYSIGNLLDKELWQIGLFPNKGANDTYIHELRAKGYKRHEDLLLETSDGRKVEVEIVANIYAEELQSVIQCNIRDITESRNSARALAKASAYTDDIISTLREPFMVLDSDLRIKTANRSFYDLFQVSKTETENRLVYDLGNGQWDIASLRILLDQVLSRNQSVRDYEVEHTFPSLGRKTMLLNARPFPPDSLHPELILLAVQDISAIRERAEELAETNRRKDEFLAMLSHELRNPLAPISNAVHFLRLQKTENEQQKQARLIIERQLTQLTRLVDDLMEVSRISTGRVQLRHDWVAFGSIVERGVETAHPVMQQRRQELILSLPDEPIWMNADAARLEQVVVNLLTNAAKYSDEGTHIWLNVSSEGNECVMRVRDTGVGIPPDLLPHVFDLFTQAERSLDRSQGGLGIGLALVQRLIELHGGRVEAHSSLGKGSEFVVRLPLDPTAAPSASTPQIDSASFDKSLRVLVVDDNRDTTKSLEMLLQSAGLNVRTAYDGDAALQTAVEYHPAVVLLDIGLPGLNGYEVAKQLRRQDSFANATFIAMTGYGDDDHRRLSLEAGFDHHLVKPVDFSHLQNILATVITQN